VKRDTARRTRPASSSSAEYLAGVNNSPASADTDRPTSLDDSSQTDGGAAVAARRIRLLPRNSSPYVSVTQLRPIHTSSLLTANFSSYIPFRSIDPLASAGNYSAASDDMKLVQWTLIGGLLHLVEGGGD